MVEVSRKRAMWQQLGRPRDIAEVEDMSAYQRLVEREGAPPPPGTKICLLQATLPMGSARAADVAEAAHLRLLRSESAALPSELLAYHAPVP